VAAAAAAARKRKVSAAWVRGLREAETGVVVGAPVARVGRSGTAGVSRSPHPWRRREKKGRSVLPGKGGSGALMGRIRKSKSKRSRAKALMMVLDRIDVSCYKTQTTTPTSTSCKETTSPLPQPVPSLLSAPHPLLSSSPPLLLSSSLRPPLTYKNQKRFSHHRREMDLPLTYPPRCSRAHSTRPHSTAQRSTLHLPPSPPRTHPQSKGTEISRSRAPASPRPRRTWPASPRCRSTGHRTPPPRAPPCCPRRSGASCAFEKANLETKFSIYRFKALETMCFLLVHKTTSQPTTAMAPLDSKLYSRIAPVGD
jgi:hypothetical protein